MQAQHTTSHLSGGWRMFGGWHIGLAALALVALLTFGRLTSPAPASTVE